MALDIDRLLSPVVLANLHEDIPPVQCVIWMGKDQYETIEINVYPFDTLDMIKFMICERYRTTPAFHPSYLFIGIPEDEEEPSHDSMYVPLDYLWYSNQTQSVRETHSLMHPWKAMMEGDEWFINANGSYSSPIIELRGRSTIEDVFESSVPVLHVYPLMTLLKEYRGLTPIADIDWNKRFAGYFPDVPINGPYQPTKEDGILLKKIHVLATKRKNLFRDLNQRIEDGIINPNLVVSGIQNMKLIWKKPIQGFEGAASLFYRLPVTELRPYLRLFPSDGSPITKLHVRGVIPIPTLEDPRVLAGWGEDESPDPTSDVCMMKYLHCSASGIVQPVYGTYCILNDGTMTLTIQPPKSIKRLSSDYDFNEFRTHSREIMKGLPAPANEYELHDMSVYMTVAMDLYSKRFTTERLMDRLAGFQPFFTTIEPLPNETPLLSLRYTAVSQYASEDNVYQFLTQYAMKKQLKGETAHAAQLVDALQDQFQFSVSYATEVCKNWLTKRERFTLQQPKDGEFEEAFHPGIDIYIYDKHPEYYIIINGINRYTTYVRLYTLLSMLFVEDDRYFKLTTMDAGLLAAGKDVEKHILRKEGIGAKEIDSNDESYASTASNASQKNSMHSPISIMDELMSDDESLFSAAPAAAVAAPPSEPSKAKTIDVSTTDRKIIDPASWFINKLKEIDKKLFSFRPVDGDKNGYTRKCLANEDRQPVALTKEQYLRMRKIYESEPIFWIEYPLEGTENPVEPKGMIDTITVMRYGSDVHSIHYYFCPEYFCLSDELMILPKYFEGTVDAKGARKAPQSCPFCHGLLIQKNMAPSRHHTVVRRRKVRGGDKFNRHILFLKKSSHPDRLELPCCFTSMPDFEDDDRIRLKHSAYDKIRSALQEEEPEQAEEEMKYYGDMVYPDNIIIPYGSYILTIQKRNILEAGKHLSPGTFGIASAAFDTYFEQSTADTIVKRTTGNLKLRPNAYGFIRMGTEQPPNESLLGVIAPLLYLNNIRQVKDRIIEVMVPLIFLHAHFGNLVMEFYDPRDENAMPSTQNELKIWAQQHLKLSITSNNQQAILRVYNSWHRFIEFINDPSQRKELRHIQPLLAEPGLFRKEGLQLLIVEDHGSDPVTVKCPIFGVSLDRQHRNEIAFISRTITERKNARYELYLYTSNQTARGAQGGVHEPIIRWNYESRQFWPAIVKTRIDEYFNQCQSRYRTVYLQQPSIHSMALLPLSKAIDAWPETIEGLVKDAYNHIMGLTFRIKAGKDAPVVMLPIVDDGLISVTHSVDHVYLDIEDVNLAPLEDAIVYYQTKLASLFSLYPGYHIKYVARRKKGDEYGPVDALQLENGIYLPTGSSKQPAQWEEEGRRKEMLQQWKIQGMVSYTHMQWEIDAEISGKKWNPTESTFKSSLSQLDPDASCGKEPMHEATNDQWESSYQQFRLMVCNWLTTDRAGPSVRDAIERIIFNHNLPEYERRKRLFIYLSPILLTWFYPDDNEKWDTGITTLLRKDCQLIDEPDACTGSCHWKQDEGKCLLHVSATTTLGDSRKVSTPDLFTKRVIDELVRFPARRKQLFQPGGVSHVRPLVQAIHEGDQYIIPESSPTWTNLLRMDWTPPAPEQPRYIEEHSRSEEPVEERKESDDIPPTLQEILGDSKRYQLIVPEVRTLKSMIPLLPFTSILGISLDRLGLPNTAKRFTKEALIQYVTQMILPIGMINLTGQLENEEHSIQFVKPQGGLFTAVTILVFLPDRSGVLVEEAGIPTVKTEHLPPALMERWKSAGRILIKHSKPAAVETVDDLPLLVQAKRKPRMGQRPV